jgi:hypothetical protein
MCEKCVAARERNTVIKRALADALYRAPAPDDPARQVPGLVTYLALCRQLEAIARAPLDTGEDDVGGKALWASELLALTPEERTDVYRIAEYVGDMAKGILRNVAEAKVRQRDRDVAGIVIALEGRDLVLYLNGAEIQRIPLAPEQDADRALDDAERAMAAHRAAFHQEPD